MKRILKMASAASAISVSKEGAAPSIPDKNEVMQLIDTLKENKTDSKADILCKKIENYIETNIKNPTLSELAKELGYSVVYTGNLVKKLKGESFSKLVQSIRCKKAAEKLLNTDLSVEEIISELGYENKNFFRKIFKAKYGENPLSFRKK